MTNIEIGTRIKMTREEKNYTLEDIAKELGMNKSTIQRYESGVVEKIKLPVVDAMARFLGVNPAWLIGKSDEKALKGQQYSDDLAFFRLKKGLETYNIDNDDIDFLLTVMKAHKERNK